MPPAPSDATISYEPSLTPGVSIVCAGASRETGPGRGRDLILVGPGADHPPSTDWSTKHTPFHRTAANSSRIDDVAFHHEAGVLERADVAERIASHRDDVG